MLFEEKRKRPIEPDNRFLVTVESIKECELFVIGKEHFLDFMYIHPLVVQNFLKEISDPSAFLVKKSMNLLY